MLALTPHTKSEKASREQYTKKTNAKKQTNKLREALKEKKR